jgi:hypothetical protein
MYLLLINMVEYILKSRLFKILNYQKQFFVDIFSPLNLLRITLIDIYSIMIKIV